MSLKTKQQNIPTGWQKIKLDDIANVGSGGTPLRSNALYWGGTIPWVTTSEIDFTTITETKEKITELGLKNSSAKLFKKGTLLIAMYGQGKTRGKVARLGIDAATNQACCILEFDNSTYEEFFFYYLASQYNYIRELSNDGGQKNLSAGIIKSLKVSLPQESEQKRIVAVLETWDQAIEKLKRKIETKKEIKKGLMHELLTSKKRFSGFGDKWKQIEI